MKCTIPEISWHNKDPVLSIDVQPLTNEGFYRLASGGTDSHVLIWHLKILETGATHMEPVSDLTRHQRAVNVVRWSNSGQYLASGDDDANIIIWHQKSDDLAVMLDGDNDDKEKWNVLKVLRGHKEDVYDICWSPDSSKLISGSVDNTAIIWDINKGLNDNILTDHKGFVQGVAWDPLGQYVATLSSDRICRVFTETGKQVKARLKKGPLSVPESHALHGQIVRYFHDDTLKSFFRRLTFSPDGRLIIAPAGCLEVPNNKKLYTTYIYTSCSLTQPAAIIPSPSQYTVAARCCPILFQLRPDGPDPVIALPYRVVFAIATRSSVVLYDTQQMTPFATISNIHYTRLTDVTWSKDGRVLAVSSTDGFCSLVTFEPEELGVEYIKEPEVMEEDPNETIEEIMDTSINTSVTVEEKKEKKPSFLEKWTKKIQDKSTKSDAEAQDDKPVSKTGVKRKSEDVIEISDDESGKKKKEDKPVSVIQVRRKPRESTSATKVETPDSKTEKPVSIIAVRRKPIGTQVKPEEKSEERKENKEDKPFSKIEVRKTPRKPVATEGQLSTETKEKSNSKDKESTSENIKNEISEVALKNNTETSEDKEKSKVAMENKTKKSEADEEKSKVAMENKIQKSEADKEKSKVAMENQTKKSEVGKEKSKVAMENKTETVAADITLLEKENITENVLKPQNDNTCTPKKEKKIATPESKKKRGPNKSGMKKSQNTPTSAKKKPREPPGGQMNITQFLRTKSTPSKPKDSEKKSRNPFILLEDYTKTGKTYGECSKKESEVIVLDDESNSEIEVPASIAQVLNFDEDSQNIKLVLEETVDEPLNINSTKVEEETMEVDENKTNTTDNSCSQKTNGVTNDNCEVSNQENKLVNQAENSNNSSDNKETIEETIIEINEGTTVETNDGTTKERNEGKNKETSGEDNKNEDIVTNGDIKNENCDTKSISFLTDVAVKEVEKPTPLSNVLSLPKGSPAKKRVPLITLSSPKHKKKPL